MLFFCFGIESFGLQERPIRISPILIKWNTDAQRFHAYFDVTNRTAEDRKLTSIIIFKVGKFRRWRGTRLPVVKAGQTESFKITFTPGIMLKNEYVSITVNLYGKNYAGLIDYSSRYVNISTRRIIEDGKTQIELTRTVKEAAEAPEETEKRRIVLGPANKRLQLLATERFQNATLTPVSPEERRMVAAGRELEPPPPEPPLSPQDLSITPGKFQNQLTWSPVDDATGYNLYWSKSPGVSPENGEKIANVESGYLHKGLTDGEPVYYVLTADKEGLESAPSAEVVGKPLVPPKEKPELSLTPEPYGNRLSWKPVDGATGYNLYWLSSSGVTPENGVKIKDVQSGFLHKDLFKPDTDYTYILTAEKNGLEGPPSAEISGRPIVPPRQIPRLSIRSGDSKVFLSWEEVPHTTEYHLFWGETEGFEPSEDRKIVVQGTDFEHTDLENGRSYYYRIAAANPDGTGSFSSAVRATPKRLEASVSELLEGVELDEFAAIETDSALLIQISDAQREKQASLKRAEELRELDISSRDKLISLYIAEGKSESVAEVLSGQLSKEPENLNLSLSLSKVYHEQGDIKAALKVLNSSLNRISLSARIALNQELKTSVRKGESTLTSKSEEAYLADEFSRLGISLLERKKYEDALSAFQSLYSLSQEYPMVKYYMGLSRRGMKQYNQAKQLFVEQADTDLEKKQLLEDLAALTAVLAVTLDIPTIKDTRSRYVALQKEENTPEENAAIAEQIAKLDALLAEAEKRRLAGLPDLGLAMADDFSRDGIQPGQTARFSFTATNQGKKPSEPFRVYYQLRHEQGITFEIEAFDRFDALPAETGSRSWKKEILIPEGAIPGKYSLISNIEQTGGKGEVTFDNNRVQSAPEITVIEPVPDLKIEFTQQPAPQPIEKGQQIDLKISVTNIGLKNSPPFEVDYFLEAEDGRAIDLKASDKQNPLPKGNKQIAWKKPLPINIDLDEGRYKVVARIRLPEKAKERNTDNNQAATGYALTFTPPFTDLSLAFMQGPPAGAVIAGESFSVQMRVTNDGNSDSSAGTVTYQLLDEDGDAIDIDAQSRYSAIQKGREPLTIAQEIQIPEDFKAGRYRLRASVEPEESDLERNTENNQVIAGTPLQIDPSFSDLALMLEMADEEQSIQPGDTISVRTRFRNAGNSDTSGVTLRYSLRSKSGDELALPDVDRLEQVKAGEDQKTLKTFTIPDSLKEGLYQVVVNAEIDDRKFEQNERNNADRSPFIYSYIKPEPVVVAEAKPPVEEKPPAAEEEKPVIQEELPLVEETEEEKVTNWVRHAAAISLAVGGAWMATEEDKKYKDAQDRENELESQYATSQSDSQVSLINSQLEDTRSQKKLYAQNTNLWTALALVGVGWEVYNIFFWERGDPVASASIESDSGGGFTIENKWVHASAISIAALAFWQSQNEVKRYNELSDKNDDLEAQYRSTSSEAEVASIRNQISSNRTEMSNHINNANIFDGITLAAIGFESYLLWKAFTGPDSDVAKRRYQNLDGFQLRPHIAYQKVGLNLKYTW